MKNTSSNTVVEDSLLGQLKGSKIVIDCGHTPLRADGAGLHFGKDSGPSTTELQTLTLGVDVYKRLIKMGKNPLLSICFSDTTRYLNDSTQRALAKEMCNDGTIRNTLPHTYLEILHDIPPEHLIFTLQTTNSNRFTNIIKRVKKDAREINDPQQSYLKYNVFFARDITDTLFCFTNGFLLNTHHENMLLDGDWWLDEFSTLHPSDKVLAPIASLKKFGIISLYSRKTGILCPATYGGLISYFDENTDHVAIYSRNDDPSIGEKIMRGVISACVLSQPQLTQKTFLQIVLNLKGELTPTQTEVSCLTAEDINQKIMDYDTLRNLFEQRLSYRYQSFV